MFVESLSINSTFFIVVTHFPIPLGNFNGRRDCLLVLW